MGTKYDMALDVHDNGGMTVLHKAAYLCQERALSLLLEYGACVNFVNNAGITILHAAIPFHIEDDAISSQILHILLQQLEQHGEFNLALIQENKGNTALHTAIKDCNFPVVCMFLVMNHGLHCSQMQ